MQFCVAQLSIALFFALSVHSQSSREKNLLSGLSYQAEQLPQHRFKQNSPSQINVPLRRQDDLPAHQQTSEEVKTKISNHTSLSFQSSLSLSSTSLPSIKIPRIPKSTGVTDSPALSSVPVLDGGTHESSSALQFPQTPNRRPSATLPQLQASSVPLPSISISTPILTRPHSPQGPPSPPRGANLVQFRPSLRTRASVPMFVSSAWSAKSEVPMSSDAVADLIGVGYSGLKSQQRSGSSSKGANQHASKNSTASKSVSKEETDNLYQKSSSSSPRRHKSHSRTFTNSSESHRQSKKLRSQTLDVSPTVTSAYISIHGRDRNAPQAFEDVYKALKGGGIALDAQDTSTVVVAPNFFIASDAEAKPGTSFFDKRKNLYWSAEGHANGPFGLFDGADGENRDELKACGTVCCLLIGIVDFSTFFLSVISLTIATGPSGKLLLAQVSTFDVLDQLVAQFSNPAVYPNMKNITITGHSAGAEMAQRWSAIGSYSLPSSDEGFGKGGRIHLRIIIANSPSSVYFTDDRPDNPSAATKVASRHHKSGKVSDTGCLFDHWRYGFRGNQPRYVELKLAQVGGIATAAEAKGRLLFSQWIRKDVVRLVGTLDTASRASGGDRSCAVKTQGGQNRRDRGYAYWTYQTLLSGDDEDVTDFYGYQNLSQSVTPLPNLSHKSQHRLGIVDGVGHVAKKMYESPVGLSALLDKVVLAGPRPPPMPDSGSGSGRNVAGGRHRHGGSYDPKLPLDPKDINVNSASSDFAQSCRLSIFAPILIVLLLV